MGASSSGPSNAMFLAPRKALWPSHTILIRPITGAMRVAIDGKVYDKPMTPQQFIDLAEDCLKAARETERVG